MKNKVITKVKVEKDSDLWRIYAQFGQYATKLNRLPDAGEIQRNPLRSAPPAIVEMVF
ncbi:hypothetical protein [Mucilaginibacter sp. SG564]|uniref:hypothetical protein n=1 Tax=Mucilaginibacter sp. SG564 TaxID=2587022 RepID=UPI0015562BDE|nr:hypothetical protein [Mucilaginibacter sp. SG564]NOW95996.1 hypothetical protein [Mucilaginibacter sp. SG564]